MEMTVCFLLLLLLCSPSTAQLQSQTDDDITALGEQTERQRRETIDASNQENVGLQDLQTFLRQLSASLAEQKEEMKRLQRENEAQEAKLESQRAEMEKLKQNLEVKQVAFSASLLASGSGYTGPFDTHTPLVFRNVVSNIGNAYSPDTGLFTAPVRGAYHFEFYVSAFGHAAYRSAAVLVKNGQHVFAACEHQDNGYGTTANGATLLLEVGDVVSLHVWVNSRIYDNENHHSTFSGHLLFTM